MKYLEYNTYNEAVNKETYITSQCKQNNIFNQQTIKFCDVLTNYESILFYIPYNPERTQGYGYTDDDAINAKEIETVYNIIWHERDKNFQIKLSYDDNNKLLEDYPEFAVYRKNNNIKAYYLNNHVYLYVNYFLDGHEALLKSYNAIITENFQNNQ